MVYLKRVGTYLKEAREARKLSIKDVARQTNITPKYIEALENEDYSQFPGETYALGFLKNYSDFLALDTDHLLKLYRGHQIDQSQTPLKELTRPTRPALPSINVDRKQLMIGGGVLAVIALIALFIYTDPLAHIPSGPIVGEPSDVAVCDERVAEDFSVPQKGAPPRMGDLTSDNLLRFQIDAGVYKICLEEIVRSPGAPPAAVFAMRINDAGNYRFRAVAGETTVLNASIAELAGLVKEVKVTPQVIGEVSVRAQFESGEVFGQGQNPAGDGQNPPGAPIAASQIQVTLQFIPDSYFEWVDDGNFHPGISIAAGDTRTLEARNRLEIKVGNGGGVRILREGRQPRIAGPPGRIVKIVYKKVPDPLDPGIYQIQEEIEVAQ